MYRSCSYFFHFSLIIPLAFSLSARPELSIDSALANLQKTYQQFLVQEFPEYTYDIDQNTHHLTDISPSAIEKREHKIRAMVQTVNDLCAEVMDSETDCYMPLFSLQKDLLYWQEKYAEGSYSFASHPLIGLLELPSCIYAMPHEYLHDYQQFENRLREIPRLIDQTLDLMEQQAVPIHVFSEQSLEALCHALRNLQELSVSSNPLFFLYTQVPSSIARQAQNILFSQAEKLLPIIQSAFARVQRFVEQHLACPCPSRNHHQQNYAWYQHQVKIYTDSSNLSIQEIHDLGITEVGRIEQEMKKILTRVGFNGTKAEFIAHLRSDPRHFYSSAQDLIANLYERLKKVESHLSDLFLCKAAIPCRIEIIPPKSPYAMLGAYYVAGSIAHHKPGIFYVDAHNLPNFPTWELDALILHEAIPGHHLQMTLAQDSSPTCVHAIRESANFTTFIEGWGLYAESLGKELGLYTHHLSEFGRLAYEMMRAVRLVVDTGLHALGWSKERAITYFIEKTGMTPELAQDEINRYLLWPAQALAYKIGELKILELRTYAQNRLKTHFNIKHFHHEILRHGFIHLDILEAHIKKWAN